MPKRARSYRKEIDFIGEPSLLHVWNGNISRSSMWWFTDALFSPSTRGILIMGGVLIFPSKELRERAARWELFLGEGLIRKIDSELTEILSHFPGIWPDEEEYYPDYSPKKKVLEGCRTILKKIDKQLRKKNNYKVARKAAEEYIRFRLELWYYLPADEEPTISFLDSLEIFEKYGIEIRIFTGSWVNAFDPLRGCFEDVSHFNV